MAGQVSDRKWVKGANGLWASYDRTIRAQGLRAKGRAVAEGVRERLAALIERDGWQRRGNRWLRMGAED